MTLFTRNKETRGWPFRAGPGRESMQHEKLPS